MITLGLDIGSAAVKALVYAHGSISGYSSLAAAVSVQNSDRVIIQACGAAGISRFEIERIAVTGYGRDAWRGEGARISELSCHALGAKWLFPNAHTVIDIGGQDFKVIALDEKGHMTHFQMNDKCAAGTGRFLDVMRGVLQLSWEEFSRAADASTQAAVISNTCTVFAESEVISQLSAGVSVNDIAAGVFASVAQRVTALAKRIGVCEQVVLSGGAVRSAALRQALEKALGIPALCSPLSQFNGALGAALYAQSHQK